MSSVFLFSKQEIQKDSVEQGIYQLFDVRPKIEVFSKRISGQYPYGLEVYEMDGFRCSDERLGTELVSKLAKHLKMELVITVINAVDDTQELDVQAFPDGAIFYGELEDGKFNRWTYR